MAENQQTINGTDGTASFTIARQDPGDATGATYLTEVEYKAVLTEFRVRFGQEMIDVTTFNEEGKTKNDPGRLVLAVEFAGLMTKGSAQSGILIPTDYQNAELVLTFSAGCTLTFKADMTESTGSRVVNQNGLITGSMLADGTITKAWVVDDGA